MIRANRARPRRSLRAPIAGGALVLGVVLITHTAGAETPPSGSSKPLSNDARADQLFRSGEKKFDGGDYAGACSDFSESLKLGPKLGTLLNLALCHETIGKPVTAWEEFSHGAVWAAQNNQRDRYEFANQHVRALEPKLPRIVLQLPADRALAALDLDGEPLPEQRWYLPLYLDPGEHRLAISAPGKQRTTVAFRVTNSPTDQVVYVPRLPDEQKETPSTQPKEAAPDPTRRTLGFAGLAVGAVGVAVGTAFGIFAITGDDRASAVKGRATIATISFVSGALFAAAGGWLLWTSTPANSGRRTALAATPRPDGGGLLLSTSF